MGYQGKRQKLKIAPIELGNQIKMQSGFWAEK